MVSFQRRANGETLSAEGINELQIAIESNDTRLTTVEGALPNKSDTGHVHTTVVALGFVFDGFGIPIAAGAKSEIIVPYNGTIIGWTVIADLSGSIVLTANRSSYTNYPTMTTISGTEKPTLASAQKNQDLALSTWLSTLTAGDILQLSVDSASTVTRVLVGLTISRSV